MCFQTEANLLCAPIHVETRIQLAGENSKKNLKCLKDIIKRTHQQSPILHSPIQWKLGRP